MKGDAIFPQLWFLIMLLIILVAIALLVFVLWNGGFFSSWWGLGNTFGAGSQAGPAPGQPLI